MTKKIFNSIIVVTAIILLSGVFIIMGYLYNYFASIKEKDLCDELELSMAAVENGGIGYLEKISSQRYRLTWISADGTVIYDTVTGTGSKENHLERAEVRSALETGEGQSKRYSDTLLEKTMYYARRMNDGSVLRISTSSATVGKLVLGIIQPVLIVIIIAIIMAVILANKVSKKIVKPLNSLDLEHPLENNTYEEITPLLKRINRQNNKIRSQFNELNQRAAEFAQITASMQEGLILMDKQCEILNINPAANEIFSLTEDSTGKDFLTVYRDHETNMCIKKAMECGHSETQQSRLGREYQFTVSRIESEGKTLGAVLLIFDITEKVRAEQSRREFTANVSHELKTPLQGIIGSAELIETGMVKEQDLTRFTGHIRKEAQRLVTLVGDIIRLSQLDEGAELAKESVDILGVVEETVDSLNGIARNKRIEIITGGEHVTITGVKKLLYEIVYNLCDNAIKYNVDGGQIKINVIKNGECATLTVEDTGIGIPHEHLERVFERFYRVDKSHSKESGGTGLGLSIVKHAAAYHNGTVSIQSEVGKGTKIQVDIPL